MALDDLVGNSQNFIPMNPNDPALFRRLDGPGPNIGASPEFGNTGNLAGLGPLQPGTLQPGGGYGPGGFPNLGGGIATLPEGHLRQVPFPRHFQPNFPRAHLPDPSMPRYMLGNLKNKMEGFGEKLGGFGETLGGYSSQFDKFGEQLGGLGEQMGGYQDALGSFNEQMGGMGQEFETVNNKLDSMEKGIAGLDQQLQVQQQPQQQQQQQPQYQNPFGSPFGFGGFGGFGGLGSLFGRRY